MSTTALGAMSSGLRAPSSAFSMSAPQRLIVALGNYGPQYDHCKSNIGFAVGDKLMKHCRVPYHSVHDPHCPYANRSSNRTEDGTDRVRTPYKGTNERKIFGAFMAGHRPLNSWCTEPFKDYNGLWCDRLLLGESSASSSSSSPLKRENEGKSCRTALLLPHTMAESSGESVALVLRAHRQFKPNQMIVVCEEPHWSFGVAQIHQVREVVEDLAHEGVASVLNAVADHYENDQAMGEVFVMRIGVRSDYSAARRRGGVCPGAATHQQSATTVPSTACSQKPPLQAGVALPTGLLGSDRGGGVPSFPREPRREETITKGGDDLPADGQGEWMLEEGNSAGADPLDHFSAFEEHAIQRRIAPVCAFTLALWTMDPNKATAFAARRISAATNPFDAVHAQEAMLWKTLQRSMLTVRDEALLASVATGWVPKNMARKTTEAEGRKVLDRIAAENERERRR